MLTHIVTTLQQSSLQTTTKTLADDTSSTASEISISSSHSRHSPLPRPQARLNTARNSIHAFLIILSECLCAPELPELQSSGGQMGGAREGGISG